MNPRADVSAAVIIVTELARSVDFYSEVLGCELSLREVDSALLLTPSGFQIYLIAKGKLEPHPGQGVGDRHLLWETDSLESLKHFEELLRARGRYTETGTAGGVTFVQGHDPDGIRVAIAYPSPKERPRTVVSSRLYT